MAAMVVLFWCSIAVLAYSYVGFPLLVVLVGLVRSRAVRKADTTPSVSLLVAAYNEEEAIGPRIENALQMDYPAGRLDVIVASDGSTDRTAEIAARYPGVRVLTLPRGGKIRALNAAAREASGEILMFSDANVTCDRHALRRLVRNFADPAVGGVAGHTSYRLSASAESSGDGERLYWSYDSWLKRLESRSGSIVSAHGALYAIRRSLHEPVHDGAVTDDFAISTTVIARGYRLVYEPEARATELTAPQASGEFSRRVRLMTRGLRGVVLRRRLLNPVRYGFYAVVLASHKIVRRLCPVTLLMLALASAVTWPLGGVYTLAAAGQAAFYLLAGAGYLTRRSRTGRTRVLYVPFYYCMANLACAHALAGLVRGTRIETWQPQR